MALSDMEAGRDYIPHFYLNYPSALVKSTAEKFSKTSLGLNHPPTSVYIFIYPTLPMNRWDIVFELARPDHFSDWAVAKYDKRTPEMMKFISALEELADGYGYPVINTGIVRKR